MIRYERLPNEGKMCTFKAIEHIDGQVPRSGGVPSQFHLAFTQDGKFSPSLEVTGKNRIHYQMPALECYIVFVEGVDSPTIPQKIGDNYYLAHKGANGALEWCKRLDSKQGAWVDVASAQVPEQVRAQAPSSSLQCSEANLAYLEYSEGAEVIVVGDQTKSKYTALMDLARSPALELRLLAAKRMTHELTMAISQASVAIRNRQFRDNRDFFRMALVAWDIYHEATSAIDLLMDDEHITDTMRQQILMATCQVPCMQASVPDNRFEDAFVAVSLTSKEIIPGIALKLLNKLDLQKHNKYWPLLCQVFDSSRAIETPGFMGALCRQGNLPIAKINYLIDNTRVRSVMQWHDWIDYLNVTEDQERVSLERFLSELRFSKAISSGVMAQVFAFVGDKRDLEMIFDKVFAADDKNPCRSDLGAVLVELANRNLMHAKHLLVYITSEANAEGNAYQLSDVLAWVRATDNFELQQFAYQQASLNLFLQIRKTVTHEQLRADYVEVSDLKVDSLKDILRNAYALLHNYAHPKANSQLVGKALTWGRFATGARPFCAQADSLADVFQPFTNNVSYTSVYNKLYELLERFAQLNEQHKGGLIKDISLVKRLLCIEMLWNEYCAVNVSPSVDCKRLIQCDLDAHTQNFIRQAQQALADNSKTLEDIEQLTVDYLKACSLDGRPEIFTHPAWEQLFKSQDGENGHAELSLREMAQQMEVFGSRGKKLMRIFELLLGHPKVISCSGLLNCLTRIGSTSAEVIFQKLYAKKFYIWDTQAFKETLFARYVPAGAGIVTADDVIAVIMKSSSRLRLYAEVTELGQRLIDCANSHKHASAESLRNYLFAAYLDYERQVPSDAKVDDARTAQALFLCLETLGGNTNISLGSTS